MRHQRPYSAYRGALSFHAAGSSIAAFLDSIVGVLLHAARSSRNIAAGLRILLLLVRNDVRQVRAAVGRAPRALDLGADLVGAPLLAQAPVGEQLEEHRHEEDGEEGGGDHAA